MYQTFFYSMTFGQHIWRCILRD